MQRVWVYEIYIPKKKYQVRGYGWLLIVKLAPPSDISITACIDTILSPFTCCVLFFLGLIFDMEADCYKKRKILTVPRWPPPIDVFFCPYSIVCVSYTCACDFISVTACLRVLLWENISTQRKSDTVVQLEAALKPYLKIYLYSLSLYVHTLSSNAHGVTISRRSTTENGIVWYDGFKCDCIRKRGPVWDHHSGRHQPIRKLRRAPLINDPQPIKTLSCALFIAVLWHIYIIFVRILWILPNLFFL